jgi:DNA-binding response OmpR family regulator
MSAGSSPPIIINRILVVDDDREAADALKAVLAQWKHSVDIAKDAGQAYSSFRMHIPDLVIVDLILPNNVSGFEVCEWMKRENENVPVVILTAIDMDDARDLASRVGADGYLTKPFDPELLRSTIQEAAEKMWRKTHGGGDRSSERVKFICGECGKKLRVSATHRGRTMNCPQCGQPVVVPKFD